MSLQDDFKAFLSDIEPSKSTVDEISRAHNALRSYLDNHDWYSEHCEKTFLSGSYAKHTCIRPVKDDDHRDVDIVIETDYSTDADSANVIIELRDALIEAEKYDSAKLQTHSVGITLSKLDIDVVPLAVEDSTRHIGCIDDSSWSPTDPKGHIEWSSEVNAENDGKYKPVVKIMKWWRRENCPDYERWPKGITLEKIIADHFPDGLSAYEEILIALMENIIDSFEDEVDGGDVPRVEDPCVENNNLAAGYSNSDFKAFIFALRSALDAIQEGGSCNSTWRKILGNRFPAGQNNESVENKGLLLMPIVQAISVPHRQRPPWPLSSKKPRLFVVADVTFPDGHTERISDNGTVIPKDCTIDYRVIRASKLSSLPVRWQVVNTGKEAYAAGCPRGEFEPSNISNGGRQERTAYTGRHYVQCFVLKGGRCIAHSKEFFINVE